MVRPKIHDETLWVRLLEEAGRLLAEGGPQALSLRKLAAEVGTSTTAVYSLFGGKPELMEAVHQEASRRFGAKLAEVDSTADPVADLARLAEAYRNYALANPHLYTVMFGQSPAGDEPEESFHPEDHETFKPLLDMVHRAADAGLLVDQPPLTVAMGLWATVHGLVSLELNRYLDKHHYRPVVAAALRGWLTHPN